MNLIIINKTIPVKLEAIKRTISYKNHMGVFQTSGKVPEIGVCGGFHWNEMHPNHILLSSSTELCLLVILNVAKRSEESLVSNLSKCLRR